MYPIPDLIPVPHAEPWTLAGIPGPKWVHPYLHRIQRYVLCAMHPLQRIQRYVLATAKAVRVAFKDKAAQNRFLTEALWAAEVCFGGEEWEVGDGWHARC